MVKTGLALPMMRTWHGIGKLNHTQSTRRSPSKTPAYLYVLVCQMDDMLVDMLSNLGDD